MTTTAPSIPRSTAPWRIDPASAEARFSVRKRLLFVKKLTVTGRFDGVAGSIELDEAEPANSRVEATIRTTTVDTGNARRDKHLRGHDFFDVEQFPTIAFRSRTVTPIDSAAARYRITGDLTVRNITRTIELDTHVEPQSDSRSGRQRFTGTVAFNRHDFGMNWSSPLIKIYDDVTVTLAIEAIRQ